jgi:hypothetical protein
MEEVLQNAGPDDAATNRGRSAAMEEMLQNAGPDDVWSEVDENGVTHFHINAHGEPGKNFLLSFCDGCFRNLAAAERKVCGACRRAAYCSKECQVQAWKSHKPVCAVTEKARKKAKKERKKKGTS